MPLKDKEQLVKTTETPAQDGDKTAPNTGKAPGTGKTTAKELSDSFRRAGRMLRESLTADQKAVEGSKSDTVTFIHSIWSPAHKQSVTLDNTSKPGFKVVGFAFKSSEDVTVPIAPLVEKPTHLADVEGLQGERAVKAGEEFILNLVETAMFLGRAEYAGECSGDGKVVRLCASYSGDRDVPLPNLKFANGGSVKTGAVECATNVGTDKAPKWQVNPGYEMFANLYKPRSARGGNKGTSTREAGEETKTLAAAFRAFYQKKGWTN